MEYTLYKEEHLPMHHLAEGHGRQLAIWPERADYEAQDFLWRLSVDDVQAEETAFTRLPDYQRVLLVLEGEVVLAYEGERVARLRELEQDRFDGDFQTKSFGRITAYNLMVQKGSGGFLETLRLTSERQTLSLEPQQPYRQVSRGLYCHRGYALVTLGEEQVLLKPGQQLVIHHPVAQEPDLGVMGEGVVVCAQVFFGQPSRGTVTVPKEKATFADFREAAKLSMTNFRGSQYLFPHRKDVWYDEALQKGIGKLERYYIPLILWAIGVTCLALLTMESEGTIIFGALGLWSLLMYVLITPFLYFLVLPKPIKAHIKPVGNLTDYERAVREKEKSANPKAERILKKYTITGRNVYLPDKPKKKRGK